MKKICAVLGLFLPRRIAAASSDLRHRHAVVERGAPGAVVEVEPVGVPGDRAVNRAAGSIAGHEEAVLARICLVGREAPEEAGLLHVGAAVLGAEHVAVTAFVAEVGVVGQLVLLGDPEAEPG